MICHVPHDSLMCTLGLTASAIMPTRPGAGPYQYSKEHTELGHIPSVKDPCILLLSEQLTVVQYFSNAVN